MSGDGLAARRAALAAMRAVDEDGTWSNVAVPAAIAALEDVRDRGFAAHLAYETLRWQGSLDEALDRVLSRPLADVEPALRRVLRLGAVQLLVSRTPARAAVSTSATLAREQVPARRAERAAGFVNGVLRALARRGEDALAPADPQDPRGRLVTATAHPAWVVDDLLERYGTERAEAVLMADNVAPGVTLRAVAERAAVLDALAAEGFTAAAGSPPEAVRAPGLDPRRSRVLADGLAVVQDEASMRVVHATAVGPGDRVLDLCAGPGGKTTHLAQLAGDGGAVTAVELHEHRARLITEAAQRVGVDVDVRCGDALAPPLDADARYEVVLVDAPCSGLGTGRRRPEVRWRRSPADVDELAALQHRLLEAAARRVAPGGTLTYAVCTWTSRETDEVADAFDDAAGPAFTPVSRTQLTPDVDGTDGMYIAVWRRVTPTR